ncbi:MAG: RagB/SusD family nutrient uptake outer membrane protein [Prevotella sp.]|nr:RagB/SusD family nutrient uptake outer membrane protein [Prevotella sp.]
MKTIYKTMVLLITAFSLSSCEDMLDILPQDKLTPETYFTTEAEIKLFTNGFYSLLPTGESLGRESADIVAINELIEEVSGQRVVPAKSGNWSFNRLRDINFYLAYSANCKDPAVRLRYDAVARFFRAYFYFEKVKRYGDVPWYDQVLSDTDEGLTKPRDSRELVMTKILEDLDFAIANLDSKKSLYRVTKWSALALKSRVCLFEGTFRKYHNIPNGEKYLEQCVDASSVLMKQGGYSLYKAGATPYFTLFSTFEDRPEEFIMAKDYNESLSISHFLQSYFTSTTLGRPGITKRIVNSYLMKDGTRFTDKPGYETMEFYDEMQNRDPRLSQTVRTPGYKQMGSNTTVAPNFASSLTGYQIIKYSNDKKYDKMNGYNDIPLFRYAEVLLNYAEAKAELGNITQSDINQSIKLLRDRVGMPNLNLEYANAHPDPYLMSAATGYPQVNGKDKGVILEIRRERTIELMVEGLRYWDLMRWKEGKAFEQPFLGIYIPAPGTYDLDKDGTYDVCFFTGSKPSVNVPLIYELNKDIVLTNGTSGNILIHGKIDRKWNEEKDYLYPIPIEERALTSGAITQNPGWADGLDF